MRHNPDDLRNYHNVFIAKKPESPIPSHMKRYDDENTTKKVILNDTEFYL